jgi:hypothetical protein
MNYLVPVLLCLPPFPSLAKLSFLIISLLWVIINKKIYIPRERINAYIPLVVFATILSLVLVQAHPKPLTIMADLFSVYLSGIIIVLSKPTQRDFEIIFLLVIGVFLLLNSFYYFFDVAIFPFHLLFGGDVSDLIIFGVLRHPGFFDEPSTFCYVAVSLFIFCRRYISYSMLLIFSCFLSTSIGGMALAIIVVGYRFLVKNRVLFFLLSVLVGIFFFNIDQVIANLIELQIPYISNRLSSVVEFSDGSLGRRISSFNLIYFSWFGMDVVDLQSLYLFSSVKGLGFFTNLFAHLGLLGLIFLIGLVSYLNSSHRIPILIFYLMSKFHLVDVDLLMALIRCEGSKKIE